MDSVLSKMNRDFISAFHSCRMPNSVSCEVLDTSWCLKVEERAVFNAPCRVDSKATGSDNFPPNL